MEVKKTLFGTVGNQEINRVDLINSSGASVSFIEFGARLISLCVPDSEGRLDDVIMGYDNLEDYVDDQTTFGATNGRVANRIAYGKMTIDGVAYELETNLGDHHIHGGTKGLKKSIWTSETFEESDKAGVIFSILSPDGDDGYPGNLQVQATYTWNEDNELHFDVKAETDKSCPVNITQHAYFNLDGSGAETIENHLFYVNSNERLAYTPDGIPTGKILSNSGSSFDFSTPTQLGLAIERNGGGYDVNMILNDVGLTYKSAELIAPASGRKLEIFTSRPALQVYTADHLDGQAAKNGAVYNKYAGISLEPQYYPDSIHHSEFPETLLEQGNVFHEENLYKFSTVE